MITLNSELETLIKELAGDDNSLMNRYNSAKGELSTECISSQRHEWLRDKRNSLATLLADFHKNYFLLLKVHFSADKTTDDYYASKAYMDLAAPYIAIIVNLHLNVIDNRMSYLENKRAFRFAKKIAIVSIVFAAVSIVLAVVALLLTEPIKTSILNVFH